MPIMNISENGLQQLRGLEQCSLISKWDANGWAIGYGHHGVNISANMACTKDDAENWLQSDTKTLSLDISNLLTITLNQGQFDVLIIFAYNIGLAAFRRSTLLQRLNSGNTASIPSELGRWIYSDGKVNDGLKNRRGAEIALWVEASKTETQA